MIGILNIYCFIECGEPKNYSLTALKGRSSAGVSLGNSEKMRLLLPMNDSIQYMKHHYRFKIRIISSFFFRNNVTKIKCTGCIQKSDAKDKKKCTELKIELYKWFSYRFNRCNIILNTLTQNKKHTNIVPH